MKKITLIAAIVFAVTSSSDAQVQYGVKAGANFYKFSGSDANVGNVSPKFKVGFAGGGFANIALSEMFSIQPELLYSMEGSKYEQGGEKIVFKTNYINIPLLVQYNTSSGFYGETGPQLGILGSAKATYGSMSQDFKDQLKGINFSWAVGLGYKLTNGLGVGARYNIGLMKVDKQTSDDVKVGGFHIGLFYTLNNHEK